jgi:predicted RNA binding protein YcfA (HicA-like mRNA interferase family)
MASSRDARQVIERLERDGWSVGPVRGSGHRRATHPCAWRPVMVPGSPGSSRAPAYVMADARRALDPRFRTA